jgi:NOL1/NOP2/fmu family ribosome biogenesis protein
MNLDILTAGEKKKILASLNENFGFKELHYLFIKTGKERVRAFSGSLSMQEIKELGLNARIELIGLYAFKEEKQGYRIAFDSLPLFKDKIKKNVVEVNDERAEKWMQGKDLEGEEFKELNGVIVLKNKEDLIGCGLVKKEQGRVINLVPKERRIK